jgi:hypothetical protein
MPGSVLALGLTPGCDCSNEWRRRGGAESGTPLRLQHPKVRSGSNDIRSFFVALSELWCLLRFFPGHFPLDGDRP